MSMMSNSASNSLPSWRTRVYLIAVVSFAIACGSAAVQRTLGTNKDESVRLQIALAPESGPLPQCNRRGIRDCGHRSGDDG